MWSPARTRIDVARVVLDHVEVLEHRVGGPAIPLGDPPPGDVRLEQLHAAGVAVEVPRPPEADVIVQRAGVVLGQDDDVVDVGVDAVRQGEVDDPVLAAERHRGLGPNGREDREALTFAAGEDHGHRPLHGRMLTPTHGASGDRPVKDRCRLKRLRGCSRRGRPRPGSEEEPRVREAAVEHHGPVEMAAGRVAGRVLVADDLARFDARSGLDSTGVAYARMWAYQVVRFDEWATMTIQAGSEPSA